MGELFMVMYFFFYMVVVVPIFYFAGFLILRASGHKETLREFLKRM